MVFSMDYKIINCLIASHADMVYASSKGGTASVPAGAARPSPEGRPIRRSDFMANEHLKDFNAMLREDKGMPRIQIVTDPATIQKYGGTRMFFAPPMDYDRMMRKIPAGKLTTVGALREYFASQNDADFTEPITAGVFVSIAAWASFQRETDLTPWWRTLKAGGELNPKYPGGVEAQKEKLEAEGHKVVQRGRKNIRYYVQDYEKTLVPLDTL